MAKEYINGMKITDIATAKAYLIKKEDGDISVEEIEPTLNILPDPEKAERIAEKGKRGIVLSDSEGEISVNSVIDFSGNEPVEEEQPSGDIDDEKEIIAAIKAGGKVKLGADLVLSKVLKLEKNTEVELDLNQHTISADAGLAVTGGMIQVPRGSKLAVKNGTIDASGNGTKIYAAISITFNGDGGESECAELVVDNVNIKGSYYAVCGNGSRHNSKVTINSGKLEGLVEGFGIYNPQNGEVIINGGEISGTCTGIEIRAGKLVVNGGLIKGLGVPTSFLPNGSGTTTDGAGIGICQHTTKLPIQVEIKGGEIQGHTALYEVNAQHNSAEDIAKISINVSGGKLSCINDGTASVYSEDFIKFIGDGVVCSPDCEDKYKVSYVEPEEVPEPAAVEEGN